MSTREDVEELIEKLLRIENEKKLLQEDQRLLFSEYSEKLDIKAVKAAVRIAKIKATLGDSEPEMENMLDVVERKITV